MSQPNDATAYEQQLVALGRVLQTLREEDNLDSLVQAAIAYIRGSFKYTLIWVGIYDRILHQMEGKGGELVIPELQHQPAILTQCLPLNPGDVLEQVVIQQRAVGIADLREEPRAGEWRQLAKKHQIQGTMAFPIRHRDRCFGVALLGSRFWGVSPHSGEKARLSMLFGTLAESLNTAELQILQVHTKHPLQSVTKVLQHLRNAQPLDEHLAAVAIETQTYLTPHRTSIYWFEQEHRFFWRRVGCTAPSSTMNRAQRAKPTITPTFGAADASAGIAVQDVSSFYKALLADQLVAVGESQSSLKAGATTVLAQHIQARSLLAAPILFQNELLGFLMAEGDEPRMWSDDDKQYIHSAAQLVALATPLAAMEQTIAQVRLDQQLTATVARAICDENDWQLTLKTAAEQLCQRLGTERFVVLAYNPELADYEITYQMHPQGKQQLRHNLPQLNDVDQRMLAKSMGAISIENLDEDLKLLAWRDPLLTLGVKSLLVCPTMLHGATTTAIDGLVIVAHAMPRSWTRTERELVQVVAQQLGIGLNQWQMQQQLTQQQQLQTNLQWGVRSLQTIQTLPELEQAALESLTHALQVPLALLVTWQPQAQTAQISACVTKAKPFQLDTTVTIPRSTDALINWALQSEAPLPLLAGDLPSETHAWLSAPGLGTLLVTALFTAPTHTPQAVLIVADQAQRVWSEPLVQTFSIMARQIAWARRYLLVADRLSQARQGLQQLNWYKHQALDEIHQRVSLALHRLGELLPMFAKPDQVKIALTRYQQVLRQLQTVMSAIALPLQQEEWQLQINQETIPLASLLKRMLERSDGIIHQRQLWTQVHNELNLSLVGDVLKTEMILHELMQEACERSQPGGRIDIWCRAIDAHWLEIAITDHSTLEPALLTDLNNHQTADVLQPSSLDQPPGLHFAICQQLVQQVGGELNLYQLEDQRTLSRLVLPISTGQPQTLQRPPRSVK